MKLLRFWWTVVLMFWADGASPEPIKLTTLEWPPYTTQSLPDDGRTTARVRQALIAAGFEPTIVFLPWARAVRLAGTGEEAVQGYFPEYYSAAIAQYFLFSEPIGGGWLVLAEHRDRPAQWETMADLSRYPLGVVQDYVNTEALDQAIAAGTLRAEAVSTDQQNLRKLLAGRIDLAVIDEQVFTHLMNTDPLLRPYRSRLQINPHKLEYKAIYLCLRRTPENEQRISAFNAALRTVPIQE